MEGCKIVRRVIAGRGMEDSVAVNIALAKGLLWCAIKGNRVSRRFTNYQVIRYLLSSFVISY